MLATVSEVRPSGMEFRGRAVMSVRYAFTVDGRAFRGATTTVTPPTRGASLWVLYDPKDPDRNVSW